MAVMSARFVAQRLLNVRRLSGLYHDAVEELRRDAVRTTVNALWRRYKQHQKLEEPRSFVEWLVSKQHFEATFWQGSHIGTRRRWAFRYYALLTRKELTLADDPDNLWVFDALQRALDNKNLDPNWEITVEAVTREGVESHAVLPGVAFMFGKVERSMLQLVES